MGKIKLFRNLAMEYHYLQKVGVTRLARRFFVMNSFDGILTTLGFLSGSFVGGITNSKLILTIGISAGIAIALSGALGVFLTESAERKVDLKRVNRSWFNQYSEKKALRKAHGSAAFFLAIIDGFSPLLATLVVLSPFMFYPASQAYFLSFPIAGLGLFLLGGVLGKISHESFLSYGLKMLGAGIASVVISFLLLGKI